MSYCEKNDLNIFNAIVYDIHSIEDLTKMRRDFLESVRLLIPFRSANFYLASSNKEHILGDPVAIDFPLAALEDYLETIEEEDPARWVFLHAKNMVYREDEFFSQEAIQNNKCFQDFYYPNGLYHPLQVSLAREGQFLGSLSFYRKEAEPPFSDYQVYFLDLLKDHLAFRLYHELHQPDYSHIDGWILDEGEHYGLTQREKDVLRLLAIGQPTKEIASLLYISPYTVKKHTMNIFKKLHIKSRRELETLLNP